MVDKTMRIAASIAIREYLGSLIGSYSLDDVMWECRASNDATCNAICSAIWYFYSDEEDHQNTGRWQIAADYEAMARRWVKILESDWEMSEPVQVPFLVKIRRLLFPEPLPFNRNKFWPFGDERVWNAWLDSQT